MKIYAEILKLPFNFYSLGEKQIMQAILKRKDYSFVIGYYLMVDQDNNERIKSGEGLESGIMESQIFRKIMGEAIDNYTEKILEI